MEIEVRVTLEVENNGKEPVRHQWSDIQAGAYKLVKRGMNRIFGANQQKKIDTGPYQYRLSTINSCMPTCKGCDGSGIRTTCEKENQQAPPGFLVVERCDTCELYSSDVAAALDWGRDINLFHWRMDHRTCIIARPRERPA